MLFSNAFAQSAPAAGGDAGGLMSFIPLILTVSYTHLTLPTNREV